MPFDQPALGVGQGRFIVTARQTAGGAGFTFPRGSRALAHRSASAQRIPIIDYLLAASAQQTGAAVIHYDHDYDTLAQVMEFDSIWLAPAGSLP